jgi:hypothetical protein
MPTKTYYAKSRCALAAEAEAERPLLRIRESMWEFSFPVKKGEAMVLRLAFSLVFSAYLLGCGTRPESADNVSASSTPASAVALVDDGQSQMLAMPGVLFRDADTGVLILRGSQVNHLVIAGNREAAAALSRITTDSVWGCVLFLRKNWTPGVQIVIESFSDSCPKGGIIVSN